MVDRGLLVDDFHSKAVLSADVADGRRLIGPSCRSVLDFIRDHLRSSVDKMHWIKKEVATSAGGQRVASAEWGVGSADFVAALGS
jgi:hypothetical protein